MGNRHIDQVAIDGAARLRIVAAIRHLPAIVGIAQHRDEDLVELQVTAAGIGESAHRLFVSLPEIVEEVVELRIDRFVDRGGNRPAIERRRRRNGHFRRPARVGFDELEVLDHRMAGKADFARDLHAFVARRHRGEGNAAVHDMPLDAVQPPQKIEMPP